MNHYVFQPIMSLEDRASIAYQEMLFRPGNGQSTDVALKQLEAMGLQHLLDQRGLEAAAMHLKKGEPGLRLAVNINPSTVIEHGMSIVRLLSMHEQILPKLVIEVTEHLRPEHKSALPQLCENLELIKKLGVTLAMDDFGAGFWKFEHWSKIKPHWIKLTQDITQGRGTRKQEALNEIVRNAARIQARLIAEGVESRAHVQRLIISQITYGQGRFLGNEAVIPYRTQAQTPVAA